MALQTQYSPAGAQPGIMSRMPPNGAVGDEEEVIDQILALRDVVLAGRHPQLKLSPARIDLLKSSLSTSNNFAAVAANSRLQENSSLQYRPTNELDPIFLRKSDSLVRAEGSLKRQRIEREIQAAGERERDKDRDPYADGQAHLDIDAVLLDAWQRVHPVTGLKTDKIAADAESSFDENDYYSSQVQSDWSSDDEADAVSDPKVGNPHPAGNMQATQLAPASSNPRPLHASDGSNWQPQSYQIGNGGSDDEDDDDDDYDPPAADAFDGMPEPSTMLDTHQDNEADDEDDSEYEPGDITQDSNNATPRYPTRQKNTVPIIRNHLTHLAAPQPNRVSPLTSVQSGNVELQLVNGRPEVRQGQQPGSRASTMSPPQGAPPPPMSKKAKKRKREADRQAEAQLQKKGKKRKSLPESRKKPGQTLPQHDSYRQFSNAPAARPPQYAAEPPRSALRYEYAQPPTPNRIVTATGYPQDPRHLADRRRAVSNYQARDVSPDYEPPVAPYHPDAARYGRDEPLMPPPQLMRAPSPPRGQPYSMPPPQRIVVDQYGNRYVAADPVPPTPILATPIERPPLQDNRFERAPSRAGLQYAAAPTYEYAERMPPPPMPARHEYQPEREQRFEYVNHGGHKYGGQEQRFDMMPPPAREPTSPVFAPPPRSYSVRPEEAGPMPGYGRQPSVAPTQFYRQDAPVRAVSVMPGAEYGNQPVQQRSYSYAQPSPVKYVDQYGNPVHFG